MLGESVPAKIGVAALLASLIACMSASEKSAPMEQSNIGKQIVDAIKVGRDLAELQVFHRLYRHDGEAIAILASCEPKLLQAPHAEVLHVDWYCEDESKSRFTEIHIPDGQLSKVDFQPSLHLMKPTRVALEQSENSSREDTVSRFLEAVSAGQDPTLGGLIPISVDHLEMLSSMANWVVFRQDDEGEFGPEVLWLDDKKNPTEGAETTIHFDDHGRPIGLWIKVAPIRTTVITTTKPL